MAQQINDRIFAQVDTLPTLPEIATELLELTLSENASAETIAELVSRDPSMSAKLLKVVNSAAFGLRFSVSSIRYATTILGMRRVRTLVLSLSVFDTLSKMGGKGKLDRMLFWKHAVASAAAAKWLANTGHYENPEEAYVASLIHKIGILLFDSSLADPYREILQRAQAQGGDSLTIAEQEIFGTTHTEIGAQLAARWRLPQPLVEAIRYHVHPEQAREPLTPNAIKLVQLTATADHLAWSAGYGLIDTVIPPTPGVCVLDMLAGIELPKAFDEIHAEVSRGAEIFRYGEDKEERWQRALLRANAELGRIAVQLELANRGLSSLNSALINAQQRLGEEDPVDLLLAEIVSTLGYDRAFLLAVESNTKFTVAKATSHDGTGSALEGSTISLDPNSQLHTTGGIRLRASSENSNHPLLTILNSSELVLAPIQEGHSLRYLLAADRASSKQDIPAHAEEALAGLTAQAGLLLENFRLYQTVQNMAVTDPLTGTFNRRRLMEVLSEEADRAARTKQPLSILILDIDHFKQLNDKLGHLAGDQVLRKAGERLRNTVRQGDLVGRYGGEEFLIVLPGAHIENARLAAERIRHSIEDLGRQNADWLRGLTLTVSIGVAEMATEQEKYEGMLGRADTALYAAKHAGRNRVCVAETPTTDPQENQKGNESP